MKISDTGVWMDGGSMTITATLINGESVNIELVQSMIIQKNPEGKLAGQIYLNNERIEQRSELEYQIVEALKEVLYGKGGMPWMDKIILAEKLEYIESEKYLKDLVEVLNKGS